MKEIEVDDVERIIGVKIKSSPLLIPGENLRREGEISEKKGVYLSKKDREILDEYQIPDGWNKSKFIRFSIRLTWFLSHIDENLLEHVESELEKI